MVRRIPCTVVRSVRLSKSDEAPKHVGQPNSRQQKIDCVVTVNVRVRSSIDSFTYTNRLDLPKATIDYHPAGRILDCYV